MSTRTEIVVFGLGTGPLQSNIRINAISHFPHKSTEFLDRASDEGGLEMTKQYPKASSKGQMSIAQG